MTAVLELTRALVRTPTINPPGDEAAAAGIVGRRLEAAGLAVDEQRLAPGRSGLVARWPGRSRKPSLCLTAHLDTVPLGRTGWDHDPLAAEVDGERVYGRGTSDMKGGLAAIVVAAERIAALGRGAAGLELVLCAGEETGCEGALAIAGTDGALGDAGAVLVAEPTSNYPCVAHKGVVWLDARTRGRTAPGAGAGSEATGGLAGGGPKAGGMARRAATALALALPSLAACGSADERARARAVTERFFAALAQGDAALACVQLSGSTRSELENQERRPCTRAIGSAGLRGAPVTRVQVYITSAKADLADGQSAFLDRGPGGWRLSAVGCRPERGKPADHPFDCELEA